MNEWILTFQVCGSSGQCIVKGKFPAHTIFMGKFPGALRESSLLRIVYGKFLCSLCLLEGSLLAIIQGSFLLTIFQGKFPAHPTYLVKPRSNKPPS